MPISELSKKLDLPAHTLRFWEKEFPSLVSPTTGAGGRRYYREETVANLLALKKYLYQDGYTIDGVKKLIATGRFDAPVVPPDAPAAVVPPVPTPKIKPPTAFVSEPSIAKTTDIDAAVALLRAAKRALDG